MVSDKKDAMLHARPDHAQCWCEQGMKARLVSFHVAPWASRGDPAQSSQLHNDEHRADAAPSLCWARRGRGMAANGVYQQRLGVPAARLLSVCSIAGR